MRLCLNDTGIGGPYREMTPDRIRVIREIGFGVAGISCDFDATDADIAHVRALFADEGMYMGPLGMGASLVRPEPADERTNRQRIREALIIGGKLGCPSLRFSAGSYNPDHLFGPDPRNGTHESMDRMVAAARELAPVAEDSGCMLCPETNMWTVIHNVPTMKEFVDRVDSPYVKIIFDPVNHMIPERVFQSGRFSACAIDTLGDRIGVIHVKDVRMTGEYTSRIVTRRNIEETVPGNGIFDHQSLISASMGLEPWKTFSCEHFRSEWGPIDAQWRQAFRVLTDAAQTVGHTFTDPSCTRDAWVHGMCK